MATKKWQNQCQEKRRFWQAHIHAWRKSGLLQKEYCRQYALSATQFCYWKKKFKAKDEQDASPKLVPVGLAVTVPQNDMGDSGLEILVGDITIRLANNFNSEALFRAVNALGGRR